MSAAAALPPSEGPTFNPFAKAACVRLLNFLTEMHEAFPDSFGLGMALRYVETTFMDTPEQNTQLVNMWHTEMTTTTGGVPRNPSLYVYASTGDLDTVLDAGISVLAAMGIEEIWRDPSLADEERAAVVDHVNGINIAVRFAVGMPSSAFAKASLIASRSAGVSDLLNPTALMSEVTEGMMGDMMSGTATGMDACDTMMGMSTLLSDLVEEGFSPATIARTAPKLIRDSLGNDSGIPAEMLDAMLAPITSVLESLCGTLPDA